MWIRNTKTNHGNVFLNCIFKTIGDAQAVIARAPTNHGISYPFCEAVLLNCKLEGVTPAGWGPVGGNTKNVHYWEYNSTSLSDGEPVDISKRSPVSRQLTMKKDAQIIANYSNPKYVLGGWKPEMAPIILSQPKAVKVSKGETAKLKVEVAAVPEAGFQWFKDAKTMKGENKSVLTIKHAGKSTVGNYTVLVKNSAGSVLSYEAKLVIK